MTSIRDINIIGSYVLERFPTGRFVNTLTFPAIFLHVYVSLLDGVNICLM